jgi:hypothetical protein
VDVKIHRRRIPEFSKQYRSLLCFLKVDSTIAFTSVFKAAGLVTDFSGYPEHSSIVVVDCIGC